MVRSEYTADRVAVVLDGGCDKLIELYMYYAGYTRNMPFAPDKNEFLKQGEEYAALVGEALLNRFYEGFNRRRQDHPFCAFRAFNCARWVETNEFSQVCGYIAEEMKGITEHQLIPIPATPKEFGGRTLEDVKQHLQEAGFRNISVSTVIGKTPQKDPTISVKIDGRRDYTAGEFADRDAACIISCFSEKDTKEGKIRLPGSASYYAGLSPEQAEKELWELGFGNVTLLPLVYERKMKKVEPGAIDYIMIDGLKKPRKHLWFDQNVDVIIAFRDEEDTDEADNDAELEEALSAPEE